MANTRVEAGRLIENSGFFKSVAVFDTAITSVSGNLYLGLSNIASAPSSSDIVWGPAQPITGFVNGPTNYAYSGADIPWADAWNKYIFIRFDGIIDGTAVDSKHGFNFVGNEIKAPHDRLASNLGNGLFKVPIDFEAQIFNPGNLLSYSFVSRLEWRITYYDGDVLHNVTRVINRGQNNTDYMNFQTTDYNIVIKKIESVIVGPSNEETKFVYNKNFIILKNPIKDIALLNIKNLSLSGVHGSTLFNGFIFGSARNKDATNNNIVKISATDSSNITYLSLLDTAGAIAYGFDQIIECSGYLYALGSNELFQINPTTLEYRSFKFTGFGSIALSPILGDQEFLYVVSTTKICKIRATDLQNSLPGVTDIMPYILYSTELSPAIPGTPNNYIHSGVVDDSHVFIATTSGSSNNPYSFAKILKSNLSILGSVQVPKATDDMTQNTEFCYLGIELGPSDTVGIGYGTYAVRKSNLEVLPLGALSLQDYGSYPQTIVSYASLFFGDFLFDFKVNRKIYQLNTLTTSDWTSEKPGMATIQQYNYNAEGIMNEVLFDADTQTFHAFFWKNNGIARSDYATFKIPDLIIFTNPVIVSLPITTLDNNNNYILNASITSSGGTPVTEAYFEILDLQNNQIETIPVFTSNGAKSTPYSSQTSFRYRFVAKNLKGTSTTATQTVVIVITEIYKFAGTVFYDELPASGVSLFLVEKNKDTILNTTLTSLDGAYEFSNLEKDKDYAIFGYRGSQRIITKIKKPFLS